MRVPWMIAALCAVTLGIPKSGRTQSPLTGPQRAFVGRVSLGWNYYSKDASLAPELNSMTNTYSLGYRFFDPETGRIRYRFQTDFYQKNTLAAPTSSRFDHRYVFRQLYGSYGDRQEIKAGKVIPMNAVVDAYPINGVSAENIAFGPFEFSAFGGTINDFYENTFAGSGHDFGGAAAYKKSDYTIGAGATSEKFNGRQLNKGYAYVWYRPWTSLQISSKSQYTMTTSSLGYSRTHVIYKFGRRLTLRVSGEYVDRSSLYIPPADTLHSPDNYFYSSKEKTVSADATIQTFQTPGIGSLSVATTVKKRLGNGDLLHGGLRLTYQNYFWYTFQMGLNASYTSNQWLKLARFGFSFNRGFLKDKLDLSATFTLNSFQWKGTTSTKTLSSVGLDFNYRFSRTLYAGASLSEEFGNAFDPRTSAWIRLNYSFR